MFDYFFFTKHEQLRYANSAIFLFFCDTVSFK